MESDVQCLHEKTDEFRGIIFCINCGLEFNELTFDEKSFHVLRTDNVKNNNKKVNQSTLGIETTISSYVDDERVATKCLELYNNYRQGKSNSGRFNKLLLYVCKKFIHESSGLWFDEDEEMQKFNINKTKMRSKINKIYDAFNK